MTRKKQTAKLDPLLWKDVAQKFSELPEYDATKDGGWPSAEFSAYFDRSQATAAALMLQLQHQYGAIIDLDPDNTVLSLGGVTVREAYGTYHVIQDWLRKSAKKLGINFIGSTIWRGPIAKQDLKETLEGNWPFKSRYTEGVCI